MKHTFLLIASITLYSLLNAQFNQQFSGGEYSMLPQDDMTAEQRAAIFADIEANEALLLKQGKLLPTNTKTAAVALQFPMAWNDGFDGYNFYAISNYVDHNAAYPNQLLDWNCGNRTYDTEGGYNHAGIDYFLWPFDWNLMEAGAVKIVAAAPGQIVARYDGNFDQNCAFNPGSWNAVFVRHDDGSVAWYGHLKNGSVTAKGLGDLVEVGEYLGTIGSSGNSTGPHLHFEVYDADDNLIDPFAGDCNDLNATTWWADPNDYIEPQINKIQTNVNPPEFMPCPELAITNESNAFMPGDVCYFLLYAKDLSGTDLCHLRITQADGSIWHDWEFYQPADYYVASYWYWWYTLPSGAPEGEWTWSCELAGEYYEHKFIVGDMPTAINESSWLPDATASYNNGAIQVNLNNEASNVSSINLINSIGQTMMEVININEITNHAVTIPVEQMSAGIYYITIHDNKSHQFKSIPIVIND